MGDLTRAVWQDSNMSLSKASPSSAVLLKLSITSESCVYKYSPLKPPQQSKCVLQTMRLATDISRSPMCISLSWSPLWGDGVKCAVNYSPTTSRCPVRESQEESQGLHLGRPFTSAQAEPVGHVTRVCQSSCSHDMPLIWCPDSQCPIVLKTFLQATQILLVYPHSPLPRTSRQLPMLDSKIG